MSKPYDATLKAMLEASPLDWPRLVGVAARRAEVIDADVSTVTAATDKVLRLREPDGVLHFDFQAGPDASVPRRVHGYSALLEERHGLPVKSVVVLLRPEANLRAINGLYRRTFPGEARPYLKFRYQVVRVWELSAPALLAGGLGTLPLAPISAVGQADLPGLIERLKVRLAAPRSRKLAGPLWTAIDILMGLRYERAVVEPLLRGVRDMKESVTYQAIVEEGVVKGEFQGARRMLYHFGERRFGAPPGAQDRARVESINDIGRLEQLHDRVLEVRSWKELLADVPAPEPRRARKRKA